MSFILAYYRPTTRVPYSLATSTQPLTQSLLRYLSIIVTISLMVCPCTLLHGSDESRVAYLDILRSQDLPCRLDGAVDLLLHDLRTMWVSDT